RLDVLVGDRPVVAESVDALAAKIVGPEAKRDAPPVIGAAAEHAGTPPAELRAGGAGIRLAVDLPTAVARVELAEGAAVDRRATVRGRVTRDHHRTVFRGEPFVAGLEHDDARARLGEHVGGHAAARARADDRHVVDRSLLH